MRLLISTVLIFKVERFSIRNSYDLVRGMSGVRKEKQSIWEAQAQGHPSVEGDGREA